MNINFISPINSLGYGMTGLHLADELINLGHDVALFPIGQIECDVRHQNNIQQALTNARSYDVNAPCVRLWHQHDLAQFVGKGKHIGFPIFELDTFTDHEKHHLGCCDELMVCSKWALNICAVNLFNIDKHKPIKVVPLGVDTKVFHPIQSAQRATIFLNCGKWEVRKGHDILHKLYNLAFNESDNVQLWMLNNNPFLSLEEHQEWENKYKYSKMGHTIKFISRLQSDIQVAQLMQQADVGIFPSRAEGWNLEALELLACGKHLIVTNYSAHTEFCTQENSWLVPINNVEPAEDGKWFFRQGNWGAIDTEAEQSIIEGMRHFHGLKQSGQLELNVAGITTANKFTWVNSALQLLKGI